MEVNCDSDHYLLVTKFRESLVVHMEMLNLKKLNEKQYRVEISNTFLALENISLRRILIELGKLLYQNISQRV
jgi:predicted rRNA methylase YqxC with S4 and FtsJ domains